MRKVSHQTMEKTSVSAPQVFHHLMIRFDDEAHEGEIDQLINFSPLETCLKSGISTCAMPIRQAFI